MDEVSLNKLCNKWYGKFISGPFTKRQKIFIFGAFYYLIMLFITFIVLIDAIFVIGGKQQSQLLVIIMYAYTFPMIYISDKFGWSGWLRILVFFNGIFWMIVYYIFLIFKEKIYGRAS